MKPVLILSLVAALGMGLSGPVLAHGNGASGGGVYWSDGGYSVGVRYYDPYVGAYWAPPRYYRGPRGHRHGHRHGYDRGYRKGYKKGYRKGKRHGHRDRKHRHYYDY